MRPPKILLASPYPLEARRGNSVSARRIAGILAELGYPCEPIPGNAPCPDHVVGDLMIALHARKSAPAIRGFAESASGRPLIVMLTGSDVHGDLPAGGLAAATVFESLRYATSILTAQGRSLQDVPEAFLPKAWLVPKSVDLPLPRWSPIDSTNGLRVVVASHLRAAKGPDLALAAARCLPADTRIRIEHVGDPEDPVLAATAQQASEEAGTRYHWLGSLDRQATVERLACAHLALNTSRVEGGANALCEAIHMGVPCVATAIPGNVGMLGEDHPGLVPEEDGSEIAATLSRAASDAAFMAHLIHATSARAPLFSRDAEKSAWSAVLERSLATHKKWAG